MKSPRKKVCALDFAVATKNPAARFKSGGTIWQTASLPNCYHYELQLKDAPATMHPVSCDDRLLSNDKCTTGTLSEPLKSAVEFTLTNFYVSSAAAEAKKFLASLPSMTTTDAQLKAKIYAKKKRR